MLNARLRGRGPAEVLGEAATRVREFLSSRSTLVVLTRDTGGADPANGRGLRFVEATPQDAAAYEKHIATDSARTFAARLGPGMHCFLAMDGTRIVHATWVTTVAAWTRELRAYLVPPPRHAYIYESYTTPEARGRGAYPFVLANIVGWAKGNGLERLWVAVEADNAASLRAVEKAGFRRDFEISFARSLGRLEIVLPKPSGSRLALEKKLVGPGDGQGEQVKP